MKQREDKRQFLMAGDSITLQKLDINGNAIKNGAADFSIISVIGSGGSSVCYEARCENSGFDGRLKEFYPKDFAEEKQYFVLSRNGENQLTAPDSVQSANDSFLAAKKEFKDSYCSLAQVKNNKNYKTLKNYIPHFVLFEGTPSGENQPKTVYVWTEQDANIIQFDRYLEKMREDIENAVQPEHHLFNILTALLSLTKCISDLHTADLIHLDIKPSNFGIYLESNGQVNAENISLFDVNTLYSAFSKFIRTAGTDGFRAPEVDNGNPGSKSDIYSIGATLFNAIVVSDGFDGLYRDEYYDDLDSYISNSKLINCSDNNANAALHDLLAKILKSCLAHNPKKRYNACSELAEDIKNARAFMFSAEARSILSKLGKDVKIIDAAEAYLDKETPSLATGAIQRLLFEHPLYDKDNPGTNIDVLVLGAGTYAQKFIDIAFEVSQVKNCNLRITAVSNNVEADKERYLKSRPAFTKFFTVDGVSPDGESFGCLDFVSTEKKDGNKKAKKRIFDQKTPEINEDIISDILLDSDNRNFSYIFIALGDDKLNQYIAEECVDCSKLRDSKCRVFFTWYGKEQEFASASPVYINKVIADTDYYRDLKRMALNCHMLWNNSLNIDLQKIKGEFSSPYYFNSSFSHILSIKYKLHSVDIYNMDDYFEAAKAFARLCKENKDDVNSLVQYEHRRWMVNYICQGWNTLKKEEFYLLTDGTDSSGANEKKAGLAPCYDTKDKRDKLHPCIVHSDSKYTLSLPEWKNNNHEKWDTATEEELAKLDGLDRMSVELHRHFKKKADSIKSLAHIQNEIDSISATLKTYPEALKVFNKFVLCISEITEGKHKQTNLYTYYEKALKDQAKDLPKETASELDKKIRIIKNAFFPILQSQKYTDYKKFDRDLVLGIPFILTYSTGIRLCVPFGFETQNDRNNRILFGNIASSLVLNPSVITYVIDAEEVDLDKAKFKKSLNYALNCIQNRHMQAKINLLFLQPEGISVANGTLKSELKAQSKHIGNIEVIDYDSDTQLKEKLLDYIKLHQKNKRKCFSAIEKNSTGISKLMRGLGCYEKAPSFKYSSVKCEFETDSLCEYFKYVEANDYLRVSDMFDFHNAENSSELPEMQLDYEFFWKLYKSSNIKDVKQQNEKVWKKLCEILKNKAEENDLLFSIKIPNTDEKTLSTIEKRTYYIPVFCRDAVEKTLRGLTEISTGFTGQNPQIVYHNTSTCKVEFRTTPAVFEKLEELFSNPYILYDASKIRVEKFRKEARIYFDSLKVERLKKVSLTSALTDAGFSERLTNLLKQLEEKKYIVNFRESEIDGETYINFTYSSAQIKTLMTNEGKILELYVYYKTLEQNYFDDIANSCEVVWNKDNVSNEFDIVVTKGYKALLIECKARPHLEQDFYYKLAQLNQRFGINAVPVLVADTIERPNQDNSVNDMQRSRGNELGVKTVYKPEEIISTSHNTGIGATLRRIMEELA